MKKAILIPILLVILILLFLFFFFGKSKKSDTLVAPTADSSMQAEDSGLSSFTGNLMDVLKMGKAVKCTASFSDENGSSDMTLYTAGQKSYSEMTTDMGGEGKMTFYSIYDGEYMYTWNDEGAGTKMKVADIEELGKDVPAAEGQPSGEAENNKALQQNIDYKCSNWKADNSMFTPPSGVEFVDMAQTMKDLNEAMDSGDMENVMDSGCAACDLIPDAAGKAECKANLSCE